MTTKKLCFTFHYVSIKTINATIDFFVFFPVFTFHYVSIKTRADTYNEKLLSFFTFHYVSIKTENTDNDKYTFPYNFTFHYVSIKTIRRFI